MRDTSSNPFTEMLTHSSVLSFLILIISFNSAEPSNVHGDHEWDLLIFTQSWPATVCKEWKHNPSHKCLLPSRHDSWTIHGIWPTKLGTIGPGFCNSSWHFDPEKIKPIEPTLLQSWANIEAETSTYALWSHEWTKHGTCAAVLNTFNSELKYFSKGLEWLKSYSMTDILHQAGIIPSNDKEYSIGEIHNAVHSKLGVDPAIECRREDGTNWLVEIRICFDKTMKLIDCDGIKDAERKLFFYNDKFFKVLTNCDQSQQVLYPHDNLVNEPNRIYVQLYKLISWLQWFTF